MKRLLLVWALVVGMGALTFAPVEARVSTTVPRNDYIGNGATATYSYTFRIFEASDLRVTTRDTANVETALVLNTDYTVTGVNRQAGGTITLVAGNLTSGYALSIRFDRTPKQSTDLRNQGSFFAEVHEDKFDELTRYAQQLTDETDRALKLPETETGTSVSTTIPIATERASKFLGFDASGHPIAAAGTSANLGPVSSFINTLLDDADAATARATLGVSATAALDSQFRVTGSADITKKIAFEIDGLTTGQTRTITPPDADLTIPAVTAKGDIMAASASGVLAKVAVGANGTVLVADSTATAGVTWAAAGFSTGDVKLSLKTSADTGWVLMNDGSIGSASSGATTRANADTEALYTLIYTNVTNDWAPVTGGRGASAAADFAANKALTLPKALGRALAGYGSGTITGSGVDADVDITANDLTVPSNNVKWVTGMLVTFTLTSGTVTGLTSGNPYYVIRSSATKIQLASSLANAQNGTAIDFTAKSTPVWSIAHAYTARVMGEAVGEQTHAMSLTELLSHRHTGGGAVASTYETVGGQPGPTSSGINTSFVGGNAGMNIQPPTLFLNVLIKL